MPHPGSPPPAATIRNRASGKAWVIVLVILAVAAVGVFAARQTPAYADYLARSDVDKAMTQLQAVQDAYQAYYLEHRQKPASLGVLHAPEGSLSGPNLERVSMNVEQNLEVVFAGRGISGDQIILTPTLVDDTFTWICTPTTLPLRLAPHLCTG